MQESLKQHEEINGKTRKINSTILILQCIGIVAVVLGHADIGNNNIPSFIAFTFPYYSWHMPFFVFISGYLFNRDIPGAKYVLKKTRTLLLPAFVANVICGIVSTWIRFLDLADYGRNISWKGLFIKPFTTGYQFYINVSLWFVFALYTIEIVACVMDRIAKNRGDKFYLAVTFLASLYCCYCVYYDHEGTRGEYFNAALRFGFLMFFFWLGICYRKHWENKVSCLINIKTSTIIYLLQTLAIGLFDYSFKINTRDMDFSSITVPHGFWIAIVSPITALIFFLGIAYTLSPFFSNNKVLHYVGRNTKYVVYYHQLCFVLSAMVLAALMELNLVPDIPDFSLETMRKSAYYAGGNANLTLLISIVGIVAPIYICTEIQKMKKVKAFMISGVVILLILLLLFVLSRVI